MVAESSLTAQVSSIPVILGELVEGMLKHILAFDVWVLVIRLGTSIALFAATLNVVSQVAMSVSVVQEGVFFSC